MIINDLKYADETQEQQVERLIKLLQDQNGDVRKNAASTLGSIGEGAINAVPALVQALKDQNGDVRKNAAPTLGSIGEGAINAVPALVQALKDQDQDVRRNAATALIRIGTPEALKAVKEYESQQ